MHRAVVGQTAAILCVILTGKPAFVGADADAVPSRRTGLFGKIYRSPER
jgi:hypothetical protein